LQPVAEIIILDRFSGCDKLRVELNISPLPMARRIKLSKRITNSWLVGAALLLFLVPFAFSQDSVQLTLENGGNYTMDGIYVGPYTASQLGQSQSVSIICDDFSHEVTQNETWTASVTSVSTLTNNNLGNLQWGNQAGSGGSLINVSGTVLQGYTAMVYLAAQMLPLSSNPANAQTIGYMAYAIWAIFDASGVQSWLQQQGDSGAWSKIEWYANNALSLAVGNKISASQYTGWEILTPTCLAQGNCGSGQPQEFMEYVPEGGTALMYLLLGGVCCFGTMFLKSRRRRAVSEVL
jgi:hypothetical protein